MTTDHASTALRVLAGSLGVRKGETLLVFTDDGSCRESGCDGRSAAAELFGRTATGLGLRVDLRAVPPSGGHGREPDEVLWSAALGVDAVRRLQDMGLWGAITSKTASDEDVCAAITGATRPDAVIALSTFSTSHTLFRRVLCRLGSRYASMPRFEPAMFDGPLDIDFGALEAETLALRDSLARHETVRIRDAAGTDLILGFAGRAFAADTGNLRAAGSFGNLPAGEIYLAPLEHAADGTLAVTWSSRGRLDEPLVLTFERGSVVAMAGDRQLKDQLEHQFGLDGRCRVVAELGIGTNPGASRPDNVLEAEKIKGTCHVAIGDNVSFGGTNSAPMHMDFVVFDPIMEWR